MDNKNNFSYTCIFSIIMFLTAGPVRGISYEEVQQSSRLDFAVINPDSVKSDTSIRIRKNILSIDFLIMFPALGYSRIIPISDKAGFVLYTSITPYFDFLIDVGTGLTLGKNHHFFEPGGGYLIVADKFYLKAGYRYQGKRGFVFRVAPGYLVTENVPWFTTSLGYAF